MDCSPSSGTGVPPVRIVQPTHGRDARAWSFDFFSSTRQRRQATARARDVLARGGERYTLRSDSEMMPRRAA